MLPLAFGIMWTEKYNNFNYNDSTEIQKKNRVFIIIKSKALYFLKSKPKKKTKVM